MTIPFISIPLNSQSTLGTMNTPYGVMPTHAGTPLGQPQYHLSQPMSQQATWGMNPNTPGNPSQVLAYVPVPQGLQSFCQNSFAPSQPLAVECSENQSEFVLSFDVPGIQADDLEVSVAGNTLQINGVRKGAQEAGVLNYSEIPTGVFSRAIALPFEVTGDKSVNTCLENGVLKIRVTKSTPTDRKPSSRKMRIG